MTSKNAKEASQSDFHQYPVSTLLISSPLIKQRTIRSGENQPIESPPYAMMNPVDRQGCPLGRGVR